MDHIFKILVLQIVINVAWAELKLSEKDWDEITGDFVIDNAELVKSITEDTECEWIKIINNYYEVIVVSDNGEERVETVQIHTTDNGGVEKLILRPTNPKDGIEGTATLLSYLSCYHHNDSKLIDVIKREYLRPPSNIDHSSRFVPAKRRCSQYRQDEFLDRIIFQGKVKHGFFVEAGADDFLFGSNTLLLEEKYNWTGLLIEPYVYRYELGLLANRKAWSSPVCLSTKDKPDIFHYSSSTIDGGMSGIIPVDLAEELMRDEGEEFIKLQCLPLFSLLSALNNPTVNLLSLDIEGAEFEVFKTIPWENVDIEVIVTELLHAGEVFPGTRQEIIEYLETKNYQYVGNIFDDVFVRQDLLGSKYTIDYSVAKELFPLFSGNLEQNREDLLETFSMVWGVGENADPLKGACFQKDIFISILSEYNVSQIYTI